MRNRWLTGRLAGVTWQENRAAVSPLIAADPELQHGRYSPKELTAQVANKAVEANGMSTMSAGELQHRFSTSTSRTKNSNMLLESFGVPDR